MGKQKMDRTVIDRVRGLPLRTLRIVLAWLVEEQEVLQRGLVSTRRAAKIAPIASLLRNADHYRYGVAALRQLRTRLAKIIADRKEQ